MNLIAVKMARRFRVLLIPTVLVAIAILAAVCVRHQESDKILNNFTYCISSLNSCNNYYASHDIIHADSGDSMCTQSGSACLDNEFIKQFNGFGSLVLTTNALESVVKQTPEYFPHLALILMFCCLGLVCVMVLFGIEVNKYLISGDEQNNDKSFELLLEASMIMLCTGLAVLCFSSYQQYVLFFKNTCLLDKDENICDLLQEHRLKINSVNNSPDHLIEHFPHYMLGSSVYLSVAIIVWVYFRPRRSAAIYIEPINEALGGELLNSSTTACADFLLSKLMLAKDSRKQWPTEFECLICLELVVGLSDCDHDIELGTYDDTLRIEAGTDVVPPSSNQAIVTSCGHFFHYTCLHEWLTTRWATVDMKHGATCPGCRSMLFDDTKATVLDRN